jgi:hypothetical protein
MTPTTQITQLTKGSYGITFHAKYTDIDKLSPFKSLNYSTFDNPVNDILIKICCVNRGEDTDIHNIFLSNNYKLKYYNPNTNEEKKNQILNYYSIGSVSNQSFNNEIKIQADLVFKSFDYLDPLCPCIIHTEIINTAGDNEGKKQFENMFAYSTTKPDLPQCIMREFIECANNENCDIGIIVMEYLENYTTLNQFLHNRIYTDLDSLQKQIIYDKIIANIIYKLIEMVELGFIHNDFHKDNIMISKSENDDINIQLIDFGFAVNINDDTNYSHIQEEVTALIPLMNDNNINKKEEKRGKVNNIIKDICLKLNPNHPNPYEYICNVETHRDIMYTILNGLYKQREQRKEIIKTKFNVEPYNIYILPLNKSKKEKLLYKHKDLISSKITSKITSNTTSNTKPNITSNTKTKVKSRCVIS